MYSAGSLVVNPPVVKRRVYREPLDKTHLASGL